MTRASVLTNTSKTTMLAMYWRIAPSANRPVEFVMKLTYNLKSSGCCGAEQMSEIEAPRISFFSIITHIRRMERLVSTIGFSVNKI